MKISKIRLLIGLFLVIAVIATACQPAAEPAPAEEVMEEEAPAEEEEAPAEAPHYVFGLVTKTLNNPFWDSMRVGGEEAAAKNNSEIVYLAPTQPNNLEEQTRLVDDLIARKVDGIVLVPVDSAGIVPAIERANEAGIPVALANTRATGGEVITFSAVENYDAMTLVAQYLVDELDGVGKVIVLDGIPSIQTSQDRKKAVDDVFAANPGIEVIVTQLADMQRAKGLTVMENLIQAYPEFDAVIALNDEMALGAIEALDAAGLIGTVKVAGFDGNNDALKAVRDGRMTVTIFQNGPAQAGDAVQALVDYLAGKVVPERIQTQAVLVNKDTIKQFTIVE